MRIAINNAYALLAASSGCSGTYVTSVTCLWLSYEKRVTSDTLQEHGNKGNILSFSLFCPNHSQKNILNTFS